MRRKMAQEKFRWFLSLQITLYLLLIFVQGNEDADEAYRNGRNLVLEYFLPINLPAAVKIPPGREKRDVEGSGEDESVFRAVDEKAGEAEEADNSTQNAFARFILESGEDKSFSNLTNSEGSGEVEDTSEFETSTEEASAVPIIGDADSGTTTESSESEEEVVTSTAHTITTTTEEEFVSTEMIFDKSEDFEETTIEGKTTTVAEETTTEIPITTTTGSIGELETTTEPTTILPAVIPHQSEPEETTQTVIEEVTSTQEIPTTPKFLFPVGVDITTEGLPVPVPTTKEPVIEEVFKETKVAHKALEAIPGNVLQKENLSLGADPLLITNTRLIDSEETVQLSSPEPKRLGAYIVIGLILLSFSSLVGYITFRKRMNRKRQEFESNQESNDTEKALLSLSDYKDHSELEENHLKNNEKAPIVVKSNSQINRFEKNTNFSSPKNLNTIANEKNIEKDNVLKSTAENLTQVIIEDSPKDVEEDKNASGMEKLIVKTRIDQDSIPKKPILINRSSGGYIPIPQDNST